MKNTEKRPKLILTLLWIAQVVLSLTFLWSAYMKLLNSSNLPFAWVKENQNLVIFTGIVDLLAGIGILFPNILRLRQKLTIYAAYGVILLMISACVFHLLRGEVKEIGFNIFVALIAFFIAWGRQKSCLLLKNDSHNQ